MGIQFSFRNSLTLYVVSVFHLYPMSIHLLIAVFLRFNQYSSGSFESLDPFRRTNDLCPALRLRIPLMRLALL